jgi:hypothetical protein
MGLAVHQLQNTRSGADITSLPSPTMRTGGNTSAVAGENRPYYLHQIEIEVGSTAKLADVAFMPDLSANGHGLLGQIGFFDRFTFVKFEHAKGAIEVGAAL